MRKRLFRRPLLRSVRGLFRADFRGVAVVLVGLILLAVAWRFGLTRGVVAPSAPSPRPSPSTLPPGPGSPAYLSVGPQQVRDEAFRLLEAGFPVFCGGGRQPVVALTFDDGPGPRTDEVLRILGAEDVPATFFVLGGRLTSSFGKDLIRRVGPVNAVANHGWSHRSLRKVRYRVRVREVLHTQDAIEEVTSSARLFRPPYGQRDARLDRFVNRVGLLMVLWNVAAGDHRPTSAERILRTVRPRLRPGAIILMHERPASLAALPHVIADIRARGLTPVTVPELLAIDPPSEDQLKRGHCRTEEGLGPPDLGGSRP